MNLQLSIFKIILDKLSLGKSISVFRAVKICILLFCVSTSENAFGFDIKYESFKVQKGIVQVSETETILKGQTLPLNKDLVVQSDHCVLFNDKGEVSLRKGSKFKIQNGSSLQLLDGALRAKVKSKTDSSEKVFSISGPAAVAGVRGTDFYVSSNEALGESELIVFDGKVNLENLKKKTNSKIIPAGHWGGVGGRFGSQISAIISLPKGFISGIQLQLTFN